jgi:hypothetical protein
MHEQQDSRELGPNSTMRRTEPLASGKSTAIVTALLRKVLEWDGSKNKKGDRTGLPSQEESHNAEGKIVFVHLNAVPNRGNGVRKLGPGASE